MNVNIYLMSQVFLGGIVFLVVMVGGDGVGDVDDIVVVFGKVVVVDDLLGATCLDIVVGVGVDIAYDVGDMGGDFDSVVADDEGGSFGIVVVVDDVEDMVDGMVDDLGSLLGAIYVDVAVGVC